GAGDDHGPAPRAARALQPRGECRGSVKEIARPRSALGQPMAVRSRGALELPSEIRHGHDPLRAGLEIAELDVPAAQLVAKDHREVRPVARGRLELLPELQLAQLGPRRKAGVPEPGGDAKTGQRVVRIAAQDNSDRALLCR